VFQTETGIVGDDTYTEHWLAIILHKNDECSVDAHFSDRAGIVCISFWPKKTANTLTMYENVQVSNQHQLPTLISRWNTRVFRTAQTAQTKLRTLSQRTTHFPLHRWWVALHTSITLGLVYTLSARQVGYTLHRGCSYAVAVYTTPSDVYVFLRPIATFYLTSIAIYRMPHSPHICLAWHIAIQSSLQISRLLLHLLRHYAILHVWNLQCNLRTL